MKIKKNSDKKRDAEENNSNADGQKKDPGGEKQDARAKKCPHTPRTKNAKRNKKIQTTTISRFRVVWGRPTFRVRSN